MAPILSGTCRVTHAYRDIMPGSSVSVMVYTLTGLACLLRYIVGEDTWVLKRLYAGR